jgi:Protein of unknown function, DUF547
VREAHFDQASQACRYPAFAVSRERGHLAACLGSLELLDFKRLRIPAQTSFWINVFNAGVLRDSPELELAAGPRDVQAFFELPRLKIGGHAFSLDDVQHGLLRGNVAKHGRLRAPMARDDPRLAFMPIAFDERMHFALYCAARSSPALRAFDGGNLDKELEKATTEHLQRTVRVEQDGAVVVLPKIFDWYAKDFGGGRGALEFALGRLDEAAVDAVDRRQGRVKLHYTAFDWTLNRR